MPAKQYAAARKAMVGHGSPYGPGRGCGSRSGGRRGLGHHDHQRKEKAFVSRWMTSARCAPSTLAAGWLQVLQVFAYEHHDDAPLPASVKYFSEMRQVLPPTPLTIIGGDLTTALYSTAILEDPRRLRGPWP